MQRLATILLLFVLLMNGPHDTNELPAPAARLTVQARSLMAESGIAGQDFGPLRLVGAWQLTGSRSVFGGISALLPRGDGSFIGLADSGEALGFRIDRPVNPGIVLPLPRRIAEHRWPRTKWDSESMTADPATGRIWVGFEGLNRICRYAPGFVALEACAEPPAIAHWDRNRSVESLVRLGDGRFLAIAEGSYRPDHDNEVLLWPGDPTDPATPPPARLGYKGPRGYLPTDAVWLGGDRLLVLNRRFTVAGGFVAKLTLVRLPALKPGARLIGEEIADFSPPRPRENLEALGLGRDARGRPLLWVAADNNHIAFQRNLLLALALPPGWVTETPAP